MKVSEWLYQDETVSVEERTEPAEVTLQQALELNRVTNEWVSIIRRYFKPSVGSENTFDYSIKKKEDKVVLKLKINGVGVVNDDFWDSQTNMITYNPRPALNLTWTDYIILWRGIHRHFNDTINSF